MSKIQPTPFFSPTPVNALVHVHGRLLLEDAQEIRVTPRYYDDLGDTPSAIVDVEVSFEGERFTFSRWSGGYVMGSVVTTGHNRQSHRFIQTYDDTRPECEMFDRFLKALGQPSFEILVATVAPEWWLQNRRLERKEADALTDWLAVAA